MRKAPRRDAARRGLSREVIPLPDRRKPAGGSIRGGGRTLAPVPARRPGLSRGQPARSGRVQPSEGVELTGNQPVPGGAYGSALLLLGLAMTLSLLGVVMIFSASSATAFVEHGSSYYYVLRQLLWLAVGLAFFALTARLGYRLMADLSPLFLLASAALLVLVLLFGKEVNGSRRFLELGPIVLQPSEFAKLSVVLFGCRAMAKGRPRELRDVFVPFMGTVLLVGFLVFKEPDLGTTMLILLTALAVLFLAGTPLRHLLLIVAIGGFLFLLSVALNRYQVNRILGVVDPWRDPWGKGYQYIQSMLAFGSGGLRGLGLGGGRQKFFYLPNAHTDFIFSVIGEEFGFLGAVGVLVLFLVLIFTGLRLASRAPDRLGRLVGVSACTCLGIQALVNMGATVGIFPITGVTLPFVSYGGSSLVTCFAMVGLLVSIATRAEEAPRALPVKRKERRERPFVSGAYGRGHGRARPSSSRPGRGAGIA